MAATGRFPSSLAGALPLTNQDLKFYRSAAKAAADRDLAVIGGALVAYVVLSGLIIAVGSPRRLEVADGGFGGLGDLVRGAWSAATGRPDSAVNSQDYVRLESQKASVVHWCGLAAFGALAAVGTVSLPVLADPGKIKAALIALFCSLISCSSYYLLATGSAPLMLGPISGFPVCPLQLLSWAFTTSAMVFAVWRSGNAPLGSLLETVTLNVLSIAAALVCSVVSGVAAGGVLGLTAMILAGAGYSHYRLHEHADTRGTLTDEMYAHGRRVALMVAVSSLSLPCIYLLQLSGLSAVTVTSLATAADVIANAVLVSAVLIGALSSAPNLRISCMQEMAAESFYTSKDKMSMKDRFFASMVHELRTPLHGMAGLCEMLQITEGNKMSQNALSTIVTIRDSGRRLQELIATILDSSSMNESKLKLVMESFSLSAIVDEVSTLIKPLLKQSTIFVANVSAQLPYLEADKSKIRQVLFNLLGNSAKFTPRGEVSVSAYLEGKDMMRIDVKDTGDGIPEENLAAIFLPFEQADNSTSNSRNFGGTGLGLSLAKCLIEAHDGSITVSSKMGEGSCFSMLLPLNASGGDNFADVGKLHRDALANQGPSSTVTHRTVRAEPNSQVPSPAAVRPTPAAVPAAVSDPLTAADPQPSLSAANKTNQVGFVPRRLSGRTPSNLSKENGNGGFASSAGLLSSWLAARKDEAASKLQGVGEEPEEIEVLCVDDEPINQTVVRELLMHSGFKVTSAMSGPEALELLEKRSLEPAGMDGFPNLVLMDFMMPGMTGIETTHRIKKDYPDVTMPIIMLSANDDEDTVVNALSSGCSDYINKPFKSAELLARVGLQTKALLQEVRELESRQHEALLEQILPRAVIDRLKSGQHQIADELEEVTIVFSDIVGFTSLTSQVSTQAIVNMLDQLFIRLDELTDKHGIYKVETIGDCYMVVAGHDELTKYDHAQRALAFSMDMIAAASELKTPLGDPLRIRVGMHSGSAAAGVVGQKCPRYCLFGDTVNTASRMESTGFAMCVQLSNPTYDLIQNLPIKDEVKFHSLGPRPVKGKGDMTTFLLEYGDWKETLEAWEEEKLLTEELTVEDQRDPSHRRDRQLSVSEQQDDRMGSYPYRAKSFYISDTSLDCSKNGDGDEAEMNSSESLPSTPITKKKRGSMSKAYRDFSLNRMIQTATNFTASCSSLPPMDMSDDGTGSEQEEIKPKTSNRSKSRVSSPGSVMGCFGR